MLRRAGEKNISVSASCVAHATHPPCSCVHSRRAKLANASHVLICTLGTAAMLVMSLHPRPPVCRDGERGNLLFPKDTPRGGRHADKRGRGREEGLYLARSLARSRALAEIRAFSRSSFLPSESLPRGIERPPPSLLPSFHIALMV